MDYSCCSKFNQIWIWGILRFKGLTGTPLALYHCSCQAVGTTVVTECCCPEGVLLCLKRLSEFCESKNINRNALIHSFPLKYCTVERLWFFISTVSGLRIAQPIDKHSHMHCRDTGPFCYHILPVNALRAYVWHLMFAAGLLVLFLNLVSSQSLCKIKLVLIIVIHLKSVVLMLKLNGVYCPRQPSKAAQSCA